MTHPPPAAPPAAPFLEPAQSVYAIFCCRTRGDIVPEEISVIGIFLTEDVAKAVLDELNATFKPFHTGYFLRKTRVWPSINSDDKDHVLARLKECTQGLRK